MKYALLALPLMLLAACEPAPEGEPVTRTRIDGQGSPSDAPTPSDTASGTTRVEPTTVMKFVSPSHRGTRCMWR